MKLRIITIFRTLAAIPATVLAVALALSSCVDDDLDTGRDDVKEGAPVVISFSTLMDGLPAGATRAVDPDELEPGDGADGSDAVGSDEDRVVRKLAVFMYDSRTGLLAKRLELDAEALSKLNDADPVTIEALTGTYDFYFVANWETIAVGSLNTVGSVTGSNFGDVDVSTRVKLESLLFQGPWDNVQLPAMQRGVPMFERIPGVRVKDNNLIRLPGSSNDTSGIWEVTLTRAVVRLSMDITLSPSDYADLQAVRVLNVPRRVFFMSGKINDPAIHNNGENLIFSAIKDPVGTPPAPGVKCVGFFTENKTNGVTTSYTLTYERIIMPELLLEDSADPEAASVLQLDFTSRDSKKGAISVPFPEGSPDYDLPRNTWLHLDVTIKDEELKVVPRVVDWNGSLQDVLAYGKYTLEVDRPEMIYTAASGGEQTFNVRTNAPFGWEVERISSTPTWFSVSEASGPASDTWTPVVGRTVDENSYGAVREGVFMVTALGGKLRKFITVKQMPFLNSDVPSGVKMYVGAFWRADRTGERLIRIERPAGSDIIDGEWSANVAAGEDWIVLDKMMTDDGNVGWLDGANEAAVDNGNDVDFDEKYPVNSTAVWVGGTLDENTPDKAIYFRIGLTSTYTPTPAAPARYGVVVLSYTSGGATNYQRIWVRQGEGADYLMLPSDRALNGTLDNNAVPIRGKARQFSPYNLTAQEFRNKTASVTTEAVAVTKGGGAFTQYPSQTGGQFQWAPKNMYVFNASSLGVPAVWKSAVSDHYQGTWVASKGKYESCPDGYRRFTDGSVTDPEQFAVNIYESEMSQSLFFHPEGGGGFTSDDNVNAVTGYYADGFFDRRKIVDDAVSRNSYEIAAVGILFFNPASNGSLFFPAGSVRDNDHDYGGSNLNGQGRPVGQGSFYWSSSSVNSEDPGSYYGVNDYAWYIRAAGNNSVSRANGANRRFGMSIRCVIDVPLPVPDPEPAILYYDDDGSLAVGEWGAGENVTSDNMAYVQFGSLIGFDLVGDWDPATSVKFNPTSAANYAYGAIPDYFSAPTAWAGSVAASPLVSSPDYHNKANVEAGRGDICKLVGLSTAEAAVLRAAGTLHTYDSGWRLPTAEENSRFVGGPNPASQTWVPPSSGNGTASYKYSHGTATTGTAQANFMATSTVNTTFWPEVDAGERRDGGWLPVSQGAVPTGTMFLPLTSNRTAAGDIMGAVASGFFWSSTPYNANSGYRLIVSSGTLQPGVAGVGNLGTPVRCVRSN